MGDSGSMFLGYMLAGISVIGAVKSAATIALIVPILAIAESADTGYDLCDCPSLSWRGAVYHGQKGHLHHRLLDLGFSRRQAVLLMYVISALLGLSAVNIDRSQRPAGDFDCLCSSGRCAVWREKDRYFSYE